MNKIEKFYTKIDLNEPFSQQEALWLLTQAELLDIAGLATSMRQRLHPGRFITFHIDTNPNYTNVCDTVCNFCAFYRHAKHREAYWLTIEQVMEKIAHAVALGARTVLLQGGHNPAIPFDYYVSLVKETRRRFPQVSPHFFSAPEIHAMSKYNGLPIKTVLETLYAVGQRTLPGGGAEVLTPRVRAQISPLKTSVEEWLMIHELAHQIGFKSTATMMYGHVETPEDIIEHLFQLRQSQARTGGFYAFIPWSFKPNSTALGKTNLKIASEASYLRIIAIARLVLDNVSHIQASWFSEGRKTGQLALEFGADDFGGTLLEENVLREANYCQQATIDEILHIIHDAGYVPVERDTLYHIVQIHNNPTHFREHFEISTPSPS